MQKKKRVVLVLSRIMERPMCLLCIAEKTGATKLAIVRALESISQAFLIKAELDERCSLCGSSLGPVFSLKER
jgi:hypothetical protein